MTITITRAETEAAGFRILGQPLALDLANTRKRSHDPELDLIESREQQERFWRLEELDDAQPPIDDARTLRAAIHTLVDQRISGDRPDQEALTTLNRFANAVAGSGNLAGDWTRSAGQPTDGAETLALIARSAIEVLSGDDADRLRECASDDCSMVFIATNRKRVWCVPEVCGNRARVARFAERTRT